MFKELFTESEKYKVYFIDNTLWLAYGDGSGTTAQVDSNSFITSKSGDKNYDYITNEIVKASKNIKPLKSKGNNKMYKIPKYNLNDIKRNQYSDNGKIDIWGGNIKPEKYVYMIINEGSINTINFFENKKEAESCIRSLY
jgi:hypothetical protein